jgi:transcriptional regulator with GAF, ATPase, and Fis domain
MTDDASTLPRRDQARAVRDTAGRLTAVYPPGLAWSLALSDARVEIGRRANDGVPALAHPTVSRAHFAIEWAPERSAHAVVDLGKRNPTRLDKPLPAGARALLAHNTVLSAGDVVLVYERGAPVDDGGVDAERIPGVSIAVAQLRRAVGRAAPDPSPILLIGPTGAGKEWVAREAHRLSRRRGDLVAVNCAALSPELIESQLFGHVRGAFTGATSDAEGLFRAAQGGSLFLDEVGELPESLQPKLLRALQEREVQPVGSTRTVPVDVRVIAATNRDLAREVEAGRFRRDLYARLALLEIPVPALCERRVDILPWIERLHGAWCDRRGVAHARLALTPDAAEVIVRHDWPENLRGIDRLIHHITAFDRVIDEGDLPPWLGARASPPPADPDEPAPRRTAPPADELRAIYERSNHNVAAVARHYDCDRRQIYRWLAAIGIERK